VASWRPATAPKLQTGDELNFFNDNLDYSVHSFNDLERLNEKIPQIASKYSFLDAKKSEPLLAKFVENMEVLHALLVPLEQQLHGVEADGLDAIIEEARAVEERVNGLAKAVQVWNEKHKASSARVVLDASTFKSLMGDELGLDAACRAFNRKGKSGHCSISCTPPVVFGDLVSVRYLHKEMGQGYLLVGVHTSPQQATANSYEDFGFYGLAVNKTGAGNRCRGGAFEACPCLVKDASLLHVQLLDSPARVAITCDSPVWCEELPLPTAGPWFLHFGVYDARFMIED